MRISIIIIAIIASVLPSGAAEPILHFMPSDTIDLGTFDRDEIRSGRAVLRNDGDEDIAILRTFTDCNCTKAKSSKKVIAPGDTTTIEVKFDGSGRSHGSFTKLVRIRTNSTEEPVKNLFIVGRIARKWHRDQ